MSDTNFFDGVDLNDPAAVQAASDAATAWSEAEAAKHLAELPPARREEVLAEAAPLDEAAPSAEVAAPVADAPPTE